MGHGSQYHRGVGSMGTLLPMHVLKGKKLPGHMGNEQVTIQNLEVVKVLLEDNIILVKGNVPGPKKSLVIIKSGVKANGKTAKALELVSYEEMKDEVAEEVVETPVEETVEEASETTEESSLESQE
jgi:large subunit ribosomal protein L3